MYMYAFVLSTLGPWVDLWKASYTSKQFGSFHLAYIVPFLQWLDLAAGKSSLWDMSLIFPYIRKCFKTGA